MRLAYTAKSKRGQEEGDGTENIMNCCKSVVKRRDVLWRFCRKNVGNCRDMTQMVLTISVPSPSPFGFRRFTAGKKETHININIVQGTGWVARICLCLLGVILLWGRKALNKIPRQSREMFVDVFFRLFCFLCLLTAEVFLLTVCRFHLWWGNHRQQKKIKFPDRGDRK